MSITMISVVNFICVGACLTPYLARIIACLIFNYYIHTYVFSLVYSDLIINSNYLSYYYTFYHERLFLALTKDFPS